MATHGARLLIIGPARSSDVPAYDGLDRQHAQLSHKHRPALEDASVLLAALRHLCDVVGDHVVLNAEAVFRKVAQPEGCELVEHLAFALDAIQHDDIKRADPVGDDHE